MFSHAENYKWNKYPRIPIQQTVLIFKIKLLQKRISHEFYAVNTDDFIRVFLTKQITRV